MAEHATDTPMGPIAFDTHPSRYVHWKLSFDSEIATLLMDVDADKGMKPGYELKLNSYDLGVDIELCDAIQRLRFEHPEVQFMTFGDDGTAASYAETILALPQMAEWTEGAETEIRSRKAS